MMLIAFSVEMHPSNPSALSLPLLVKPSLPSWPTVWQFLQPWVSNKYWASSLGLLPTAIVLSSSAVDDCDQAGAAMMPPQSRILGRCFMSPIPVLTTAAPTVLPRLDKAH